MMKLLPSFIMHLFIHQLDEMTDITSQAQLICLCFQAQIRSLSILSCYFKCIFESGILFVKHEIMWSKCKAVSTDSARVVGVCNRFGGLIKQVIPEVVSIHCIIHCEALLTKKLVNQEKNCQLAN